MKKLKYFAFIAFNMLYLSANGQYDARWVLGTHAQLHFCDTCFNKPTYENGNFNNLDGTNTASICDKKNGDILFYCNGVRILNKKGVVMENGDSIAPGKYTYHYYPYDNIIWNGVSIIPMPKNDSLYYVIYTNADSILDGDYLASKLFYSIIDMSQNNGLGKVIKKDIVIFSDWFENGRINVIQHANGRDWWILVNSEKNKHYSFLLTNSGIKLFNTLILGIPYSGTIRIKTQTCVNQSGTQIVYSYSTFDAAHQHRLDFYNFNRCTGLLSNYHIIPFTDSLPIVGLAFSPNDSLLYVNNILHLYQYNVKDKMDTLQLPIDTFDINVFDPFHVLFGSEKLAYDNKIYMGTWNGSRQLHCINKPNIRGKGCNFVKGQIHTDSTNHFFQGSMPNYPNFRLGVMKGSECDTIRETPALPVTDELLIYPNPNNGSFKIVNGQSNIKQVEIYSVLGQLVLKQNYNAALAVEINVKELPKSMYIVLVKNTEGAVSKAKLIKQ